MLVGVLALQGDFAEHLSIFDQLGVDAIDARSESDLRKVDALVIPGGESTTILKLIDRFDLRDLISKRIEQGLPAFGTCAGAIALATASSDGEVPLGVLPITVVRNAYGRQVFSFEASLDVEGIGADIKGAFIRAPVISAVEPSVEVLGRYEGDPVIVRYDNILATTFHPEVVGETRIHRWFVQEMC